MELFLAALVDALAAGAIAAATDTATKLVKDAYAGIRQYIKDKYAEVRLDGLEQEPKSKGQRLVVQEKLEEIGAQDDPDLPKLVAKLVEALSSQAPEAAAMVGVDLQQIHAAVDVQIKRIGEGTTIKDVEARGGSVVIEDVGRSPKN